MLQDSIVCELTDEVREKEASVEEACSRGVLNAWILCSEHEWDTSQSRAAALGPILLAI